MAGHGSVAGERLLALRPARDGDRSSRVGATPCEVVRQLADRDVCRQVERQVTRRAGTVIETKE